MAVNGVDLFYISKGSAGLPLLCMPGALGTAETDFPHQLSGLSNEFQVVSYDPRGYGKSRPPVRDFPVDFYERDAADAAALMAGLGHSRYAVMGWSDGAISAVKLAASRRGAVEKLVIFGGNAYLSKDDIAAFEATRDVEKTWSARMKETHLPVYGDDLQPMWSAACDAWAAIFEERGGDICQREARSIECPTLVLHGKKDPICLEEHAVWFADNIGGPTRLEVLAEGKHNLHLRFADEVNALVRTFLGEPSGSGSAPRGGDFGGPGGGDGGGATRTKCRITDDGGGVGGIEGGGADGGGMDGGGVGGGGE